MNTVKKVAFESLAIDALFTFERVTYRKSSDMAAYAVNRRNADPENFQGCIVTPKVVKS